MHDLNAYIVLLCLMFKNLTYFYDAYSKLTKFKETRALYHIWFKCHDLRVMTSVCTAGPNWSYSLTNRMTC